MRFAVAFSALVAALLVLAMVSPAVAAEDFKKAKKIKPYNVNTATNTESRHARSDRDIAGTCCTDYGGPSTDNCCACSDLLLLR
jgi:uncharacterized membrane protein